MGTRAVSIVLVVSFGGAFACQRIGGEDMFLGERRQRVGALRRAWENDRIGSCADEGRFCRAGGCVMRPDPDPRCTRDDTGGGHSFCDGDLAVACFDAFHAAEEDCGHAHRRCVDDGVSVRCVE